MPYQSLRELFSHFRLLESFPFDIKSVIKRYLKKTRKTYQMCIRDSRDSGLLAFTRLGGKILYRSSDIEKLLDGCYRKARTRPEEL